MNSKHLLPAARRLLWLLAVTAGPAHAQVPYDVSVETAAYFPLSPVAATSYTPTAYALGFPQWDEGVVEVPLPFTFRWFGAPHGSVFVFTNGFLSFSPVPPGTLNILPAPSVVPDARNPVHDFIAPLWQDLEAGSNPSILVANEGSAPNRRTIIQVSGLRRARVAGSAVAFQVRLEEATSSVRISYDPTQNNGVTQATVAIEDAQGVLGANLLAMSASCGAGCTCPVRGCASFNVLLTNPPTPSDTRAIVIRPPLSPELIGAIRGPAGAYPDDLFSASIRVTNVGLGAAAASTARVVLSDDTVIDGTDRVLADVPVPALMGGETFTTTVSTLRMPMPLPVARFYLGLLVDATAAVGESIEGNNAVRDPQGIVTGPDLFATLSGGLASGPGETFPVLLGLRSQGAPWSQPIQVRFVLSEDAVLDGNDRVVDTQAFTLPDGFSLDQTVNLVIPLTAPPRSYRLFAAVDPLQAVTELDETNNVALAPGTITLSLPDLDVVEPEAGATAFRGLGYPVRVRINNRGGSTARAFTACVVISRNPLISTVSDPILLRTAPLTLAGGDGTTLRLEPVIPTNTGTGAWSLAVVADCDEVVTESSEANNTRRRTDTITIRDPVPDLIPLTVDVAPSAAAGEALLTAVTLSNQGPAPGAARVRLVLSSNPGATLMDPVIYDGPMPVALDPAREQSLGLSATLAGDVRSGRYYVGAIVDPDQQVEEVDETNNIATSAAITVIGSDLAVISPTPPNAIIGVHYAWRFYAAGGAPGATYTWTGAWRDGRAPAGLTFTAATADLTGTPTALGSYTLDVTVTSGALTARESYTLVVAPPTLPLSLVSSRLPPAIQGEDYDLRLIAVGGTPPYVWTTGPGATTPPGLGLSTEGDLGGEPTMAGAYTFGVEITDAAGTRVSGDIAIDVIDPSTSLSIENTDLPAASVDEAYEVELTARGGNAPYTWRMEGRVPGLSFDGGTARLTGTPTVAGTYPVTVEVRDARGLLDRNAYLVRVFELGELSIITGEGVDSQLPRGKVGQVYATPDGDAVLLRATKRSGASIDGLRWMTVLGSLPPGLELVSHTGNIVGTPTAAGLYAFTVMAFDASGDRDRATLVIVVDDVTTAPPPVDEGCGCTTGGAPRAPWLALLVLLPLAWRARRRGAAAVAVAALVGVAGGPAQAQPVPYTVTRELVPYARLANATRITPELGDGNVFRLALPFELRLYGQTFRELSINANGVVFATLVGPGQHFPPSRNPDPGSPNGFIAGLWGDWCAGGAASCGGPAGPADSGVYYQVDATPGAGRVTIEYRSIRHFADFAVAGDINFQITLYEGVAELMELHYGPMVAGQTFAGQPTFMSARVGLESSDGRLGQWFAPCDGPGLCDNAAIIGLTNTRIRVIADAGEDVAVGSVSAPGVAYPSLPLPVRVRYVSRHGSPLGPARLAAYLVDAAGTSTAGAPLLATTAPVTLAPYETRVLDLELPIPGDVPPSRRAIMVVADAAHELAETDETNNTGLSAPIRIAERAPDLVVSAVRSLDARARPGGPIRVAWAVRNGGNEPARARAQVFLSSNEAVTGSDEPIGAPIELDLPAGGTASGTVSATLAAPHAVGAHWIGVVADAAGAVRELDETNNVARADAPLVVADDAVVFVTTALPPATLTVTYQARIEAAGGDRVPTLRLTNGALPRGLLFAADRAEIFGIPLEAGTFAIELEASSGGRTARQALELTVVEPDVPLTVLTRDLPIGVVGSDYFGPVTVVGGARPLRWRVLGSPPPGVDLATDGAFVGVPRAAGAYPFTLEVRDDGTATATVGLEIVVRIPGNLTVVDAELDRAQVGEPYRVRLLAVGGTPPYTWAPVGELPVGITVSEAGEVLGTPTELGTFGVGVRVTDAAGQSDTNRFVLTVEPDGRLAIAVETLGPATVGQHFRALFRVDGGRGPFAWSVLEQEGKLPPGITAGPGDPALNESTNDFALDGTIASAGVWACTLRLRDAQGLVAERTIAIEAVEPPPPPPPEESGCTTVRGPGDRVLFLLLFAGLAGARVLSRLRRVPTGAQAQRSS